MKSLACALALLLITITNGHPQTGANFTRITVTGTLYQADSFSTPEKAASASAVKVSTPLTNQIIMQLCGIVGNAASQYLVVFGTADTNPGIFVIKKSDGSIASTFLSYSGIFSLGDGSTGVAIVENGRGLYLTPITAILGNIHATGTLSGAPRSGGKLNLIAGVDDNGSPRFALKAVITLGKPFVLTPPNPQ